MKLEKILTVFGKPGLFHLDAQTRSGFLVTSLSDGKRVVVNARNNVSLLSEIAIYTLEKEMPISDVFRTIQTKENNGKTSVNHKDSKDVLEEYFFSILPNYDEERVYVSDIRKIIQWYNILLEKGFLDEEQEMKDSQEL